MLNKCNAILKKDKRKTNKREKKREEIKSEKLEIIMK